MSLKRQIIYLRPEAPLKPPLAQTCNGCGVCCAVETCPVSRVFLNQWRGPCRALEWQQTSLRYVCGTLENPGVYLRLLPKRLDPWFRRMVRRWIAVGVGCDCDVETAAEQR